MAEIYLFDTSIWIDLYDKRGYNGEMAKELMKKIIIKNRQIIYSDATVFELKKLGFSDHEINQIFSIAKPDRIKSVCTTKEQIKKAAKLAKRRKVPLRDALYAILARDYGAQPVSRDWHFEKLKDITKAKLPEDLI